MADEIMICCHVKTWTWCIAIVNAVQIVLGLAGGGFLLATSAKQTVENAITMGILVIWIIFVILLIVGLLKDNANFIVPHMVVSFIVGLHTIFMIVMGIINGAVITQIIMFGISIILIAFFLIVEYKCYTWMKETFG